MITSDSEAQGSISDWTPEAEVLLGLDPLFSTYVMLTIEHVLDLEPVVGCPLELYKLYSHRIQKVEITGTVTAVERLPSATNYTVNDGTGTITCVYPDEYDNESDQEDVEVYEAGTAVTVMGKVTSSTEERRIKADVVSPISFSEQQYNKQRTAELRTLYETPFEVPPQIIKNMGAICEAIFGVYDNMEEFMLNPAPIETIKNALLEEYHGRKLSLAQVMKNKVLLDHAKAALKVEEGSGDIKLLIDEAHVQLVKGGHIMEVEKQHGYFTAVDEEALRKLILKILNEATQQLAANNQYDGVATSYIVAKVETTDGYMNLNFCKEKVISVLKKMSELGDVYSPRPNTYKPTVPDVTLNAPDN